MNYTSAPDNTPARAYGRLLLRLHDLIAKEQGDGPEADGIRDQIDAPWYALTAAEQERLGALSEDLAALAENTARSVKMSAEERRQWGQEFGAAFEAGDWDRALVLLRRPRTTCQRITSPSSRPTAGSTWAARKSRCASCAPRPAWTWRVPCRC
jgi:hypothetical protein